MALLLAPALLLGPSAASSHAPGRFDNEGVTYLPVVVAPIRDFPALATEPPPRPQPERDPGPVVAARRPNPAPATVAAAQAYALDRLGPTQYACLDRIATNESHWSPFDLNKSSGAYGIPQTLPGSKMAWAGADWRTNPVTQVKWMIHYVDGRYGSACSAWAFWQAHGWY